MCIDTHEANMSHFRCRFCLGNGRFYLFILITVFYYQYSFFPMTVVLWNELPADLVLSPDLNSFKLGVSMINHAQP